MTKRRSLLLAAGLLLAGCTIPPETGSTIEGPALDHLLLDLERTQPELMADAAGHRIQLVVTAVDAEGRRMETRSFGDPGRYFYPASSIKLPVALAALAWAEAQTDPRVPIDAPLAFHPLFEDEVLEHQDPTHPQGFVTLAHEVRKVLFVSDNQGFNRCYELLGHEGTNRALIAAGLESARCHHRLSEFRSPEDQLRTPRIDVIPLATLEVSTLPQRTSSMTPRPHELEGLRIGRAHLARGERVEEPLDFSIKNAISARDLHECLISLVAPEQKTIPGFTLSKRARELCLRAMSLAPAQAGWPRYDRRNYPDDYVKFLTPGLRRVLPEGSFTLWNKVGRAYGFSVENAAIEHHPSGTLLFVTAVLYTNPNETLNDDTYAYEELADPWFAAIGESIGHWLADR